MRKELPEILPCPFARTMTTASARGIGTSSALPRSGRGSKRHRQGAARREGALSDAPWTHPGVNAAGLRAAAGRGPGLEPRWRGRCTTHRVAARS